MLISMSRLSMLGFFMGGFFLGGIILLFTVKRTAKNLKDPWEEPDEEDDIIAEKYPMVKEVKEVEETTEQDEDKVN